MSGALWLAILASVSIGAGEVASSRMVTSTRPEIVTASYFFTGFITAPIFILLISSSWRGDDFLLGMGSGVFNGVALLLLYMAYVQVPIGVAIPIVGVLASTIPVFYAVLFDGDTLTGLSLLGVILGVASVVLVSLDPQPTGASKRGVLLAVGSGVCYGIMPIWLANTSEESGMWPMLSQRGVAFLVAGAFAFRTGRQVFPDPGRRLRILAIGLFGTIATAAYLLAVQQGDLSLVAVAGAQYPAVAVGLSYLLFRTATRWWQTLGLAFSAMAVALIALG